MRNVLVVGAFGKTGIAVINYLVKKGFKVKATDMKKEIPDELKNISNIEYYLGAHNENLLNNIDFVIISPGVPSNISIILKAKKMSIPVLSEIELAYREFPYNWVGITGTDGKSTTTALTGTILKEERENIVVGGNIGEPLIEKLVDVPKDTIVVSELSSFQLENIINFKPFIGTLLNISQDHLDRYNSMEEYVLAKFNLFKNQTEKEFSIFNFRDEISKNYINKVKSKKYFFSRYSIPDRGAYFKEGKFFWKNGEKIEEIADEQDMKIYGEHNKENILAAITIAKLFNIKNEKIKKGIRKFKGLEHRMEFVAEIQGRRFINDSKATTVSSVRMSISSINGKGIIIMGGKDKGLDFSLLDDVLSAKAKYLILTGEAKQKIKNSIKFDRKKIVDADSFEGAVIKAFKLSEYGDTILLSPGCASFDMFKNFEERGRKFKEIVYNLKKEFQ